METLKHHKIIVLFALLPLFLTSCNPHIGVHISSSDTGILENTILFLSDENGNPKKAYVLGNINLSDTLTKFQHTVATDRIKNWWLIGTLGGDVVFSSVTPLQGVDMYSVEPYNQPGAALAWNIPFNILGYVNKTDYSRDWWAQTFFNHSSHNAANNAEATLWRFNNGNNIGTIRINQYPGFRIVSISN